MRSPFSMVHGSRISWFNIALSLPFLDRMKITSLSLSLPSSPLAASKHSIICKCNLRSRLILICIFSCSGWSSWWHQIHDRLQMWRGSYEDLLPARRDHSGGQGQLWAFLNCHLQQTWLHQLECQLYVTHHNPDSAEKVGSATRKKNRSRTVQCKRQTNSIILNFLSLFLFCSNFCQQQCFLEKLLPQLSLPFWVRLLTDLWQWSRTNIEPLFFLVVVWETFSYDTWSKSS